MPEQKNQTLTSCFGTNIFFEHIITLRPDPCIFDFHVHSRYELYFCLKGSGTYTIEESSYPLEENKVFIMRPGEYHGPDIKPDEKYDRYYIHFSPDIIRQIDSKLLLIRPFTNRPFGAENMYDKNDIDMELVKQCLLKMNDADHDKSINLQCYFYPILQEVYKAYCHSHEEEKPIITADVNDNIYKIIAFINQNLNENLSLELIEKHFFINRNSLTRDFKKVTGKTIWNYISDKRLFAANRMLESGVPATKAAFACGFSDYSSFYRAYKTKYRISPKNAGG